VDANAAGPSQPTRIDPDDLYRDLVRNLAEHSELGTQLLRAHQTRGHRLICLQTTMPVMLPGISSGLEYLRCQAAAFRRSADIEPVAFLVDRTADDVEIAVEAMLGGRKSVVVNTTRDQMEIEMLLLDFANNLSQVGDYISSDARRRRDRYSAPSVRRRAQKALYPGRALDLPDAQEYAHHCLVLHPTPEMIGRERLEFPGDARDVAHDAVEIVEHLGRVALAADGLLAASSLPADDRPPGVNTIQAMLAAHKPGVQAQRALIDNGALPERRPYRRGASPF